jgi:hypothetical protein
MTAEPFVFARGPPHDEGVDRAEFVAKLRGVEPPVVAHPSAEDGTNPPGDVFQIKVAAEMQAPSAHASTHSLAGGLADRWDEADKAPAAAVLRQSRPEREAEKVEGPNRVRSGAIGIFAVDDPGLLRVQLQTALRKPPFQRLMQLKRLCLAPTMSDGVIGVAFEWDVRELPVHPAVERVVKKKTRQHGTDYPSHNLAKTAFEDRPGWDGRKMERRGKRC